MRLELYPGDIFDVPADVLICSANIALNLSGGVGGELLLRFGPEVQEELHRHLANQTPRCARPGNVIVTHPCKTPYKAILHAVAVDAFYGSSPELISQLVRQSLSLAAQEGARTVALTALATGFGRLSMDQFARGFRPVLQECFPPIEAVTVAVDDNLGFDDLRAALPEGTAVGQANPDCRHPRASAPLAAFLNERQI